MISWTDVVPFTQRCFQPRVCDTDFLSSFRLSLAVLAIIAEYEDKTRKIEVFLLLGLWPVLCLFCLFILGCLEAKMSNYQPIILMVFLIVFLCWIRISSYFKSSMLILLLLGGLIFVNFLGWSHIQSSVHVAILRAVISCSIPYL